MTLSWHVAGQTLTHPSIAARERGPEVVCL